MSTFANEVIYKCGDFSYRFIPHFLKWPDGKMQQTCGVFAKNGEFFVANRSKEYPIAVFDMDGNFKRGFGSELNFNRTHGLYVTEDDKLFVCDDGRHVVYELDIYGKLEATYGTIDQPRDNGYDPTVPWPHDIYTIKRAGEPFNRPTRMIQAKNGDLYCCDGYGNVAMHKFDKDGNHLKTWGGPGAEPGLFRLPHSVWEDSKNRLWVADREGFRMQVFDLDGNFITDFKKMNYPSEPWADENYVYVVEDYGTLSIFDIEKLEKVAEIGYIGSPLHGGHSLCGDENGNLYIGHILGGYSVTKLERIR